jgi:hypothetical protein
MSRLDEKADAPAYPRDEKKVPHAADIAAEATVPVAEEHDLTFGNILRGTAAKRLTTFERKAALINACVACAAPALALRADEACSEMDKFGFGRYQICVWLLCGFGYFLDLAWSQGVGVMATAV